MSKNQIPKTKEMGKGKGKKNTSEPQLEAKKEEEEEVKDDESEEEKHVEAAKVSVQLIATPEISLASDAVPERDMRALLDRIPPKQEPKNAEDGGGWGWSSWGLPAVSMDSISSAVSDGFNSVVAESQTVMGELTTLASSTMDQASSFAEQMETALGLSEERTGFARFYISNGGRELTNDLKELSGRASDAVASMDLDEVDERRLSELASAYRQEKIAFEDEEDGGEDDASVKTIPGVETESVPEAIKSHNVILVEAHQKFVADLKKCRAMEDADARDDAVAHCAIESKNRMQRLFSLGVLELLKRAFLIISNEADKMSAISPEVGEAIESQSARKANIDEFRSLEPQLETLKLLRKFLRAKMRGFSRNYSEMVKNLPELMEDVSSEELQSAMGQLTNATQTEIVLDTETAVTIVDNCLELLDPLLVLAMAVKAE